MSIILIVLQCILLLTVVLLQRRQAVSPILKVALLFYSLMWYILPVTLGLFVSRGYASQLIASQEAFVSMAAVETVALIVCLLFLFRAKPFFQRVTNSSLSRVTISERASLLIVSLSAVWILQSLLVSTSSGLFSYLERNAFLATADESALINVGSLGFLQNLLVSFAYVSILQNWGKSSTSRLLVVLSLLLVGGINFFDLMQGGRISLLTPVLLVSMYALSHNWTQVRMYQALLVVGATTILLGSLLGIAVADSRGAGKLDVYDLASTSRSLLPRENADYVLARTLQELATKFDSFSAGRFLVDSLGPGFAGLRPYTGAFLAIVPRGLFTEKPVPGSMDGTYLGHPSRLVPILTGSESLSSNTGVSPAAISIWQLGYFGLIVLVVVNSLNLYLVNSLLLSPSLISRTLGFSLLGVPALTILFASPDQIILNIERVMAIYLVALLVARIATKSGLSVHRHGLKKLA